MYKYDKIIITNLPAFYKVKLFNEISKFEKIYVIFTGSTGSNRQQDFFSEPILFEYVSIGNKNFIYKSILVFKLLFTMKCKEFILGGWDESILWLLNFLIVRKKSLIVESSDYESVKTGVKGGLKRFFLKRIDKVYASGISQVNLVKNLGFKRCIVVTNGVGLFNVVEQPAYSTVEIIYKFLYVGRLSPEKNLKFVIAYFNRHPSFEFTIIGYGGEEEELKKMANANIKFLGSVNNKELSSYYKKTDIFILPSLVEPWGLVVEEALNNGVPVLVSNRVGCASSIVSENVGRIFEVDCEDSFESCINEMCNVSEYNRMRKNISQLDFNVIASEQVKCYLEK